MKTKRIFTGTFIDKKLFETAYPELLLNFSQASKGKWVELENLHFTYKFFGDVEIEQIEALRFAMIDVLGEYQNKLVIAGLGCFPNEKRPNVLFVKVQNEDGTLIKIFNQIEDIAEKFGFEREKRHFSPHVTLQRIKFTNNNAFKEAFAKYKDIYIGEMLSFRVNLIESELRPTGPIYSILQ